MTVLRFRIRRGPVEAASECIALRRLLGRVIAGQPQDQQLLSFLKDICGLRVTLNGR